jgi:hypothetical protein
MRNQTIILVSALGLSLAACAQQPKVAAAPPPPPGAVQGSMAADRDGDGVIDGYYTSDGIYHANYVAPPPPPPAPTYSPAVARRGERG